MSQGGTPPLTSELILLRVLFYPLSPVRIALLFINGGIDEKVRSFISIFFKHCGRGKAFN